MSESDASESMVALPALSGTKEIRPEKTRVFYTEDLAERISELYMDGMSLRKIADETGMPALTTIRGWIRDNARFREIMKSSRIARGLELEDDARDAVMAADEDNVSAQRLKFDYFKWAAEMNDPATYGKKATISGDPDRPLTFIIRTGVPDPLPHQIPKAIGADGIIIENAKEVTSEVEHFEGMTHVEEDLT